MTPELVAAARRLAGTRREGRRPVLGIVGPPGAGKSTLAAELVAALGEDIAVLAPMDGFHLADVALDRLGRRDRKGAPDTFDAEGYLAVLRRVRTADPGQASVWWPSFERELEQPLAGALEIPASVPLVVTEGNFLLLEDPPWCEVRRLLTECWWVRVEDELRRRRLVERHVHFGKTRAAAEEWVTRVDEANARRIAGGRDRADRTVGGR